MLKIQKTRQFDKDFRLAIRRGCKEDYLAIVVSLLINGKKLPERYRDHALRDTKYYSGVRECHIQPDWLLIYRVETELQVLRLIRTGTHSDLFNK